MPDDTTHDIKVVPPLLRKEVKRLKTSDGDFVHGYMVNSGAGISTDDFAISRLISFGRYIQAQRRIQAMGQSFRVYVLAYTVGSICLKKTLQPEALRPSATTSDEIFTGIRQVVGK